MQFLKLFWEFLQKFRVFFSNSETSYEFGFHSKKNAFDTREKQNAVLKKMEVILSRIK